MLFQLLLTVFLATPVVANDSENGESVRNEVTEAQQSDLGKPVGAENGSKQEVRDPDLGDGQPENGQPKKRGWIDRHLLLFLTCLYGGIFLVVGAIVLLVRAHVKRRLKERSKALADVSEELGLVFFAEGDEELLLKLTSMSLFNLGRGRKLTNLMVADTPELKMEFFDYSFVTGHGKSRKDHRMSVVAVSMDGPALPTLEIRPRRGILDAIRTMFGGQEIQLQEQSDFNRKFVVKSANEDEAREFLDPILVQSFEANPEFSFESQSDGLIYYRRNKRVDPDAAAIHELMGAGFSLHKSVTERLGRNG